MRPFKRFDRTKHIFTDGFEFPSALCLAVREPIRRTGATDACGFVNARAKRSIRSRLTCSRRACCRWPSARSSPVSACSVWTVGDVTCSSGRASYLVVPAAATWVRVHRQHVIGQQEHRPSSGSTAAIGTTGMTRSTFSRIVPRRDASQQPCGRLRGNRYRYGDSAT